MALKSYGRRLSDRVAAGALTTYANIRAKRKSPYSGGTGRSMSRSAKRVKTGKSYTRTKRKYKKSFGKEKQGDLRGRTGHSLYFSGRKYSPRFLKFITSVQTLSTTSANGFVNNYKEANYHHESILDKGEMNYIYDAAVKQHVTDAGGVSYSPVSNGVKDYKVFITEGSAEFRIANNSHHPVELIIYCYKVKNDNNSGPPDLINTQITDLNLNRITATDALTNKYIGLYPSDCAIFKRFYKVVEQEKITLNPGATHIYRVHCRWNKLMSATMKYSNGTGGVNDVFHYKGYTGGVMFRASGYPVHSNYSGEHDLVKLSTGRIDIVGIKRYGYRIMVAGRDHFECKDNQDSFTGNDGEWYDPGSGLMEKVTTGTVTATTDET